MLNKSAVTVVFSGGQDSTTCLGWALDKFEEVRAVSFDYGQTHRIELEAAVNVLDHFGEVYDRQIPHEIINLGPDTFAGTSPLTNRGEQLETYESHDQMEAVIGDRIEKTFVPMRNAVFLMLAANRAIVHRHSGIVTGVCEADNANYPDCRQSFVDSADSTINLALGLTDHMLALGDFKIHCPLMNLSKAQSVSLALTLPGTYGALAWSHTAYDGQYPPMGRDHASVLRAHGFEQADVPDPLVLRAWVEDLMELPSSDNYRAERVEWALGKMNEGQAI